MAREHFMKLYFSIKRNASPEVYDFLFRYMEDALKGIGVKKVSLEMERLEPLDEIYTNLQGYDLPEIKRIFDGFAEKHHLREMKDLTAEKMKTSLKAELTIDELKKTLEDYNLLFDVFFADIIIKAHDHKKRITVDLMDPADNTALIASPSLGLLNEFVFNVRKHCKHKVEAKHVDVHPRKLKQLALKKQERKTGKKHRKAKKKPKKKARRKK
jgi:hypothetical protein